MLTQNNNAGISFMRSDYEVSPPILILQPNHFCVYIKRTNDSLLKAIENSSISCVLFWCNLHWPKLLRIEFGWSLLGSYNTFEYKPVIYSLKDNLLKLDQYNWKDRLFG